MTEPIRALALMGQRLGGLEWVQGPGGNVSVKTDADLWVKASGTRLRRVAEDGGCARVPLHVVRAAMDGDSRAGAELFAHVPRPSMESYFHALPSRVVAHTHSLGALLHGCAADREDDNLGGLVEQVAYVRPGRGIAVALRDRWNRAASEQAFVLRSHGLVVFAEDESRAIALSEEVNARIRDRFGRLPPFEPLVATLLAGATCEVDGGIARSLPKRQPYDGPPRYLFPDAAVYATVVVVERAGLGPGIAARTLAQLGRSAILVDAEGHRLAVAAGRAQLDDACEILAAHDWVEAALSARGIAKYLAEDEPGQIVSMPSEQYRIQMKARE